MFLPKNLNIKGNKLSRINFRLLLLSLNFLLAFLKLTGQELPPVQSRDTVKNSAANITVDSLMINSDSIVSDSARQGKIGKKKPVLESEVKYTSQDSLIFSVGKQKVYLFKSGVVNYQDIGLKGDYIEFDYSTKVAMAAGAIDSSGKLGVKPEFTKGNDKYDFDTMRYNFDTHKAIIKSIITQQGEGYLHSTLTKRLSNGEIDIKRGKYTTCDAPHPHFYIALTKAISIPGKKTVSGPGYLVFEDIPVPLGLPFGFFPNTDKRTSGFLIPEFRNESRRGLGLENGGWYFALNDYLDIALTGSLYSRGSWGAKAISQYLVKYKYSGNFAAEYAVSQINDDPEISSRPQKDFRITWSHRQDPKANPTRTFSASVNFGTTAYDKRQSNNFENILQNRKNSSIAFAKKWPGRPFNFSANLTGDQNSNDHRVNLTLPSVAFSMDRIYPFRGKNNDDGKYNWFENIQVSYNSKLENRINSTDSTLFTNNTLKNMKNGFSHNIPISLANIKVFKFINIVPTVSYSGVVYPYYIQKKARTDTMLYRTGSVEIDTIHKITYAQSYSASLSINASPKLYGTFTSNKPNSYIIAVRHVLTPRAGLSFAPDMKKLVPNYYRKYASQGSAFQPVIYNEYSIYDGQLYPTPSVNGKSGSVSLGLGNNLEMKVRSKDDSTGQGKKVTILENLDFATSYRPFATTNKWSAVTMTGRSTLFKNNLQLQFRSTFDPYAIDSVGRITNSFNVKKTGKLFRVTSASFTASFRLQSAAGKKKTGSTATTAGETPPAQPEDMSDIYEEAGGSIRSNYVDYDIPWSLSVDFAWNYNKSGLKARIDNTVRLTGDISLTPKWKIGVTSSYDIIARKFTATSLSLNRDLHCWEMRFSVVPFGDYKSYSFTINARSAILRDLKWDKRKAWQDNF